MIYRPNQKLVFPADIPLKNFRYDLQHFIKAFSDDVNRGDLDISRDSKGKLEVRSESRYLTGSLGKSLTMRNYVLSLFNEKDLIVDTRDYEGRALKIRMIILNFTMSFFGIDKNFDAEQRDKLGELTSNGADYFRLYTAQVQIKSKLDIYLDNPSHCILMELFPLIVDEVAITFTSNMDDEFVTSLLIDYVPPIYDFDEDF